MFTNGTNYLPTATALTVNGTLNTNNHDQTVASLNGGGRTTTVRAVKADGTEIAFTAVVRVDTPQEVEYYRNGGILPYVLRQLAV